MSQPLSANTGRLEMSYFDIAAQGEQKGTILLVHGFASSARVNWITTGWIKALTAIGYRCIAIDNRGHGASQKFYSPAEYGPDIFAADAISLMDHLDVQLCDVMGYSMGTRISAWLLSQYPQRFRRGVFGGMGARVGGGGGYHEEIAHALETDDVSSISDPRALSFRKFADATASDRLALAACIRPSQHNVTDEIIAAIEAPVLVAVGSEDDIAGPPEPLAAKLAKGEAFVIPGKDHMKATGDEAFKAAAIEFLTR